MNYDTWKSTDTAGDYSAGLERAMVQAIDDEREQQWNTFVAWATGDRHKSHSEWATLLYHVYQNMKGQGDWHYAEINQTLQDFAETEGWPGVLTAIARAMRLANERELTDRC